MKREKDSFNGLWWYFVLVIFFVMLASTVIIGASSIIVVHVFGITINLGLNPILPLIGFLLVSCCIGTAISAIISKKMLNPLTTFTNAAKKVAKGDFSIRLDENSSIEELRQASVSFNKMVQELGSTETLRSDFVTNVSHEMKTPIAAIEGYATLLQNDELTREERNDYTARIIESTKKLSTLTSNILKISKLENQEMQIHEQVFDLDEQIRQAILSLEQLWSRKDLELDIDLAPIKFKGSEELLMQVWTNIIGNAVKFTPKGGKISVSLTEKKEAVAVKIADNGIGMSGSVTRHVFEKFYQGDSSRSSEGNGLGLALALRIVRISGGDISVESKEGEGSTFTVTLPNKLYDKSKAAVPEEPAAIEIR